MLENFEVLKLNFGLTESSFFEQVCNSEIAIIFSANVVHILRIVQYKFY